MKRDIGKIVLALALLCVVFVGILYGNNCFGIREAKLESDIRASQKIQDDWTVDGIASDSVAAFISYSQNKSDHTYSVYVNRPGFSFGYFFRGGGDIVAVEDFISKFTVEGYNERAFISLNSQKVDRLEVDDGNEVQVIDIDSDKPFAIVLPMNAGSITFYDIDGNIVEYANNPL